MRTAPVATLRNRSLGPIVQRGRCVYARTVPSRSGESEHPHVGCGRALLALLGVVGHLCALGQRLEAVAGDRGLMDEQVLAAVIGRNEAVALLVAKPFDGSGCHVCLPGGCVLRNAGVQEQQLRTAGTTSPSQKPGTNTQSSRTIGAGGRAGTALGRGRSASWRRHRGSEPCRLKNRI